MTDEHDWRAATAPNIRRALRNFRGLEPGDAIWRGLAGPGEAEVAADLSRWADGPAIVTVRALVVPGQFAAAIAARTVALENEGLTLGRFHAADDGIAVEHALLAGATLDEVEVSTAVWAVGWAAAAYAPRVRRRLDGAVPDGEPPQPAVASRRDADERVLRTERDIERILHGHYGGFARDPGWGYHGPFGSARVFVSARHYLESSTAVVVASPVLSAVDLDDRLALDVHAVAASRPFGRFSYAALRRELWFEHALLGDDLNHEELDGAIASVAEVADGEDDRLKAAHGGLRYADLGSAGSSTA